MQTEFAFSLKSWNHWDTLGRPVNHWSSSYTGRKEESKLILSFWNSKKNNSALCFGSAFQGVQNYESFLLCQGGRGILCLTKSPKVFGFWWVKEWEERYRKLSGPSFPHYHPFIKNDLWLAAKTILKKHLVCWYFSSPWKIKSVSIFFWDKW